LILSFSGTEKKLLNLLRDVIREKSPSTTLRIAGGYVRDKLLGISSNDIDIAVDNMTGESFANLVKKFLNEKGIKTGEITVVQANPAQSKHLATAMLRLYGLPIDFVNLRTETYADSRIPQMQMGTPEEDAKRRDLTINALFYNVNTGQIEDFVNGIQDLRAGVARTPMDPTQTFLDDPLRILRTVRFAAKYGLSLYPGIIEASKKPEVQVAFKDKISQERIWAELAGKKEGEKYKPGALIGKDPVRGIELLKEMGLIESIFDPTKEEMVNIGLPEEMVPWETPQNNPYHQFDIWGHTLSVIKNLVQQTQLPLKEEHETYLVRNLAALFHDIGKRYKGIQGTHEKGHTTYHNHEEISGKIAEVVLTRLHAPGDIIKRVKSLIDVHLRPHVLLDEGSNRAYRKYVRDFEDWPHSVDLAIADSLGKETMTLEQALQETQKYETLREKIKNSLPSGNINIPRPITGRDLIQIGIKPGPIMGQIMSAIDEALLDNPGLTAEEALGIARRISADYSPS